MIKSFKFMIKIVYECFRLYFKYSLIPLKKIKGELDYKLVLKKMFEVSEGTITCVKDSYA